MKIRFLEDYQGGQTSGDLVKQGVIADIDDVAARSLINTGKAEEVEEPTPPIKQKKAED